MWRIEVLLRLVQVFVFVGAISCLGPTAAGETDSKLWYAQPAQQWIEALLAAWPTGSVTGLRARGGFEVDIRWQDGKLREVVIRSKLGRPCSLRYGDQSVEFDTQVRFTGSMESSICGKSCATRRFDDQRSR